MKLKFFCPIGVSIMIASLATPVLAQSVGQTNYFWTAAGDGSTWSQGANWRSTWVDGDAVTHNETGIAPVNDGTTFQIFIGTGFPTTTPTAINIGVSDHVMVIDQLFGPEWGETLNIYGSVTAGFGFCPLGAVGGPKSTVNLYGAGSYTSSDSIFIGDPFWFNGGPNVDFNLHDNSTISAHYLMPGGHLNLYDNSSATVTLGLLAGTPTAGAFGGISSDATRWINLAGGKLILPTGNADYVLSLIGRGIFFCYGKKYDTNEFTITDDGTNTVVSVVSSLGNLNSVAVQSVLGVTNMMLGTHQSAQAVGNFENLSNVPLDMIDATQSGGGTFSYKSSNPDVASVSADGLINALKVGTTLVSVSYSNSSFGSFNGINTLLVTVVPITNSLIHRYSFSEDSGSTTTDSVGGEAWDGSMYSGATLGGGVVTLAGGAVLLPPAIVSGLDAVTIEAWVDFGPPAPFATLFAFGGSDEQAAGENYIMFQPYRTNAVNTNASALFGMGDPGSANEQNAELPLSAPLESVHLVVVYHPFAGYIAIYTNGVLAAINNSVTHPLAQTLGDDPVNGLGASLYSGDPFLNATINEFRIYNGPLTAGQIAADHALGPDQLIGTSTTVSLSVTYTNGNVVITWPATSALVNLMSSASLGAGANWLAANMSSLTIVNGNYQVTLPATGTAQFFRLQ